MKLLSFRQISRMKDRAGSKLHAERATKILNIFNNALNKHSDKIIMINVAAAARKMRQRANRERNIFRDIPINHIAINTLNTSFIVFLVLLIFILETLYFCKRYFIVISIPIYRSFIVLELLKIIRNYK